MSDIFTTTMVSTIVQSKTSLYTQAFSAASFMKVSNLFEITTNETDYLVGCTLYVSKVLS